MRAHRKVIALFAPAGVLATVIVVVLMPFVLVVPVVAGAVVLIRGRVASQHTEEPVFQPLARVEPRTVTVRRLGATADR